MKRLFLLIFYLVVEGRAATHQYKPYDLGLGPFVDEAGQCTLNPCDALGRAQDELYTALNEKEKAQEKTGNILGELQQTVKHSRETLDLIKEFMGQMERRIRSLEQPGQL